MDKDKINRLKGEIEKSASEICKEAMGKDVDITIYTIQLTGGGTLVKSVSIEIREEI
jgi:hypothetical protein